MIHWKTQSGYFYTDIGDLHIILKEKKECWQVSMGIRAYSQDGKVSMVRPTSVITQIDKPCDSTQAKERTNTYMDNFINGILNDYHS